MDGLPGWEVVGQKPPGAATTDDVEDSVKDLTQRVKPRSPGGLGTGRWDSIRAHLESERSVGYVFLMHGRVPNYHYPTPTFRTVSLGSSLNKRAVTIRPRDIVLCSPSSAQYGNCYTGQSWIYKAGFP